MTIVLDGHIGKQLLLVANVNKLSDSSAVTIYPAANIGRSTIGFDTPANTWVPGLLDTAINFGRSLFSGTNPLNTSSPGTGVINLNDTAGELEYLFTYSFDTKDILIYRGGYTQDFSAFSLVGKFTSRDVISDWNRKQIRLRDASWKLGSYIHNFYYAGTGLIEGDAELKGRWRPAMYGRCFNVEPTLILASSQIYQFHFASSLAVHDVRHGGVSLTFDANYASVNALAAATIPAGKYGTCLASSLIRPSITVDKSIRVDATGESVSFGGVTTPMNRGDIVTRLACIYGDVNLAYPGDLDSTSFTAVNTDHTADLGFFWNNPITKADALTEVMTGILGFWYIKPNGKLAIGYVKDPDVASPAETIDYKSFGMSSMQMIDSMPPRKYTRIGYKRNYGPEALEMLAGAIITGNPTFANLLTQDASYAVSGSGPSTLYSSGDDVKIYGGFVNSTDAATEAARQQVLFNVPRHRYRCSMEIDQFADIVGQYVSLTNVGRLLLASAKTVLCVSIDGVSSGPQTIEWWV